MPESMLEFITDYYLWIVAMHLVAVMFWMAGLYYLPRIFVYHAELIEKNNDATGSNCEIFERMESRLLRIIINPAMVAAWLFGGCLLMRPLFWENSGDWLVIKLALVVFLTAYHGFLALMHKKFIMAKNTGKTPFSSRFFRLINEIPPLLTFIIVILVIVKPL